MFRACSALVPCLKSGILSGVWFTVSWEQQFSKKAAACMRLDSQDVPKHGGHPHRLPRVSIITTRQLAKFGLVPYNNNVYCPQKKWNCSTLCNSTQSTCSEFTNCLDTHETLIVPISMIPAKVQFVSWACTAELWFMCSIVASSRPHSPSAWWMPCCFYARAPPAPESSESRSLRGLLARLVSSWALPRD